MAASTSQQLVEPPRALLLQMEGIADGLLGPDAEVGAVAFGHTEQLRDDRHRQRGGEVRHQVGLPGRCHRVQQLGGDLLHPRAQQLGAAGGERAGDQLAQPGVLRRVRGQHVAAQADTRAVAGESDRVQGVLRDRGVLHQRVVQERLADRLLPHHHPRRQAVEQPGPVHRPGRPQPRVLLVGGSPEVGIDRECRLHGRRHIRHGLVD
ncbi:hypothetical protein [Kitasatospora azatica]|uniref:hypothetical protein n=1 Tax=Kitasatospora azatica TaxID=58347 RepID=UPI001E4FE5C7|nr:hypothetical protein [Kitasatospora azatica]